MKLVRVFAAMPLRVSWSEEEVKQLMAKLSEEEDEES